MTNCGLSSFQITIAVLVVAPFVTASSLFAELKGSTEPRIGVKGYCIVCVVEAKRWVKGNPEYPVTYDGVTYLFPGTESRNLFVANPQKYATVLNGDSVVSYANSGNRVSGSVRYATLHKKRVYLFASNKERLEFRSNSAKYEKADIAFSGYCAVCMLNDKKVSGRPEFSLNHCGIRYWFSSEHERVMFLRNPEKYAVATASSSSSGKRTAPVTRTTLKVTDPSIVTVSGKTGCAGCEHGVTPIGAPNELGLAVIDSNGRVFVVEDAHTRFPGLYKDRFDGHRVELSGRVIRRTAKAVWVRPVSLKRVASQSTAL